MELMLTWDVYKSNITSLAFYNSKMSSEYGFENLVTVCKIKKKIIIPSVKELEEKETSMHNYVPPNASVKGIKQVWGFLVFK